MVSVRHILCDRNYLGNFSNCFRTQASGNQVLKFGQEVPQISLYGEPKPFCDTFHCSCEIQVSAGRVPNRASCSVAILDFGKFRFNLGTMGLGLFGTLPVETWISQEPWQVLQNGFVSPYKDIYATSCPNLMT